MPSKYPLNLSTPFYLLLPNFQHKYRPILAKLQKHYMRFLDWPAYCPHRQHPSCPLKKQANYIGVRQRQSKLKLSTNL
jgi:hypothetical protein